MKKEILSEELNAMKYLLGYKRGVVISEQQAPTFGNPNQFSTNPFAPNTQAPNTQTAADIYNEFQRQQGPAAQIYKDFQAKYGQQVPATGTPVPATPATAPVVAAPTTGTTAAPTTAAAPATNLSVPDLIKQVQTVLKTKFKANLGTSGPNKDGVDGVWGKNTQAALESALKTLPAAAAAPTTGTTTVVAGAPAAGTGTPPVSGATSSTQQKFNFNPNPNLNLNPESATNFKLQTPQELAKGLTTATPKLQ